MDNTDSNFGTGLLIAVILAIALLAGAYAYWGDDIIDGEEDEETSGVVEDDDEEVDEDRVTAVERVEFEKNFEGKLEGLEDRIVGFELDIGGLSGSAKMRAQNALGDLRGRVAALKVRVEQAGAIAASGWAVFKLGIEDTYAALLISFTAFQADLAEGFPE